MQRATGHFLTLVVAKRGDLRWLGHHDFARAVARALRRAGIRLLYSEGFHPRPRMRLPEPLPVGVGSDGERFVVELAEPIAPDTVAIALAGQLPAGLALVATFAGARPEPRDAVVALRLLADPPEPLFPLLSGLSASDDPLAAAFEQLAAGPPLTLRLRAGAGKRPSVGRFLAELKPRLQAAGATLVAIDRTAPSLDEGTDLQSPAPFSPPGSNTDPGPEEERDDAGAPP